MTSSNGTVSASLVLCEGNPQVTGKFPSQRASNAGFDIFFDVSLNKRLNKQSSSRWFESAWCSLWRHCKRAKRDCFRPMMLEYVTMLGIVCRWCCWLAGHWSSILGVLSAAEICSTWCERFKWFYWIRSYSAVDTDSCGSLKKKAFTWIGHCPWNVSTGAETMMTSWHETVWYYWPFVVGTTVSVVWPMDSPQKVGLMLSWMLDQAI